MSSVIIFFEHLLQRGEAVLYERPTIKQEDRSNVRDVLQSAFDNYRFDVAGPPLGFDPEAALAAAMFVAQSCWLLVGDDDKPEMPAFPLNPTSAEAHLSADLTLRYVVTVFRRVRTRAPDDPLLQTLVDALRRWPLSGALAEIADPPVGDLRLHGHFGLQLLYAERLATQLRASWIPTSGRTREAVELVLQQHGQALPATPTEGTTE